MKCMGATTMPQPNRSCCRRRCRRQTGFELLFSFSVVCCCFYLGSLPLCRSLTTDGVALLELKKSLAGNAPSGAGPTSDWNESDLDPCSWTGVACSPVTGRVTALNISGRSYCGRGAVSEICPSNLTAAQKVSCTSLSGSLTGALGNLTELRVLSLPSNGLTGAVPREIGKLKFLEILELQGNSLTGEVTAAIGGLPSLHVLNLGFNSLVGGIPEELGKCLKLQTLVLAGNLLNGTVPGTLGRLPELRILELSYNQLSGPIPVELVRGCRSLEHLRLSGNLLVGELPPQLGNCRRLRSLSVFSNILEGHIPRELGRLQSLETLDVSRNSLTGQIPHELGKCWNLSVLVLTNLMDFAPATGLERDEVYSPGVKGEFNLFDKGIPASVLRLPRIKIIWAPRASPNSTLPDYWGECRELQVLNLGQNSIAGQFPAGLGKCKSLFFLDLSSNKLSGGVPGELPVSCMVYFNVSMNLLSGTVPTFGNSSCSKQGQPLFPSRQFASGMLDVSQSEDDLGFFYSTLFYCGTLADSTLENIGSGDLRVFHDLSWNNFTGPVTAPLIGNGLLQEQPTYGFFMNDNKLAGNITSGLFASCNSLQSFSLNLSGNQISGDLTAKGLLSCKSLKVFDVGRNRIRGQVPPMIGSLVSLAYLDMSSNDLQGTLPPQLGQLKALQDLIVAKNHLTGAIPWELGQLSSLVVFDLSSNALTGKIPPDLANLTQLKILVLDKNKLSGEIPSGLANLTSLINLNVAFNNLSGTIPEIKKLGSCENYIGNKYLQSCASASFTSSTPTTAPHPHPSLPLNTNTRGRSGLNSIEIAAITSAGAIVCVLIILVLILVFGKRWLVKFSRNPSTRKDLVTFTNIGFQLTYENVVRATGSFSVGNLIGNGGFGATYKAELTPGLIVAVKRLSVGRFQGVQQFHTEVKTLGTVRHQNLVTLIGYYASESEMFLVYNYLPGGNLETFIHERANRNADWRILHKIALDIAQALSYLHDFCVPRVLHRDIKPSNILLDNDLNAYLSDFGLARLLEVSETHATTDVAGTFGYVAPEYATTCRVSDKADVYSYGVVLLELLSGKRSLDPSFSCYGNGFNIVGWAWMLLKEGRAREIFIPGLWDSAPHDDLIDTLHLAVKCTIELLSDRPSMKHVVRRLKEIQPPARS